MTTRHSNDTAIPDAASISSKRRAALIAGFAQEGNDTNLNLMELYHQTGELEDPVTIALDATTLEFTDPPTKPGGLIPRDPTGANLYTPEDELGTLQFVTVTVANENAPFIIAGGEVDEDESLAETVDSLLSTADNQVDIETVIADQQFSEAPVIEALSEHGHPFIVAHPRYEDDPQGIAELESHDADVAIQTASLGEEEQQTADVSQVFLPTDDGYTSFLTNKEETNELAGWLLQTYTKGLIADRQCSRLKELLDHPDVKTGEVTKRGEANAAFQIGYWVLTNHYLRQQQTCPESSSHHPLPFDTFTALLATGEPREMSPCSEFESSSNSHRNGHK